MERLEKLLRERWPEMELRVNEPMSKHTTFRIGGPAALMALPGTMEEVQTVFKTAAELGIEPFFLGNGSNLLVADGGYPGFVVKRAGEFEEICFCPALKGGKPQLTAGGAALLSTLSKTPRCEVGVFIFGQPGFHNAAAVGCVVFFSHGRDLLSCRMSAAGISGASRIAGFGEGTPQQVSREGQNRRIADFGTVVETCSK